MLSACESSYFVVPKPGGQREKVIHEGIQVVSDPVHEAVENLHAADGVFDYHTGGGLPPVLFLLGRCQTWIWVFLGFAGFLVRQVYPGICIIFVSPKEPKIQPQADFSEPRKTRLENIFHQCVIMDASRHDAAQQKYFSV